MLGIFKAPTLDGGDYFERSRYRLTWNINITLLFALLLLTVLSYWTKSSYTLFYETSLIIIAAATAYLKIKREYKLVSIALSAVMYSVVLFSMFSVNGYVHYLENFWLLIIVLYIYFIRGRVLGAIFLIGNILAGSFFFIQRIKENSAKISELYFGRTLSMSIEFTICMLIIGYIIHQFVFTREYAEAKMKKANESLNDEKLIVDAQNKEKTVLLQEIHHRVKNNLQVVTSLLRMQSEKMQSKEAKQGFQDATNRVLTMALIHQKMYQSDNLSKLDLSDYLESLSADILRTNDTKSEIRCELNIEIDQIGVKTVVPIALIITELITNSVKHAFANVQEPLVKIYMINEADEIHLRYSDNGTWSDTSDESFGMLLIETFTEQLDGTCSRSTMSSGTSYDFCFKTQSEVEINEMN